MEKGLVALCRLLGVVASSALVVLMFAICIDIVVRFISQSSLPGMLELAETSLVVAVYFGLAWAALRGDHVYVSLVSDMVGERTNRYFDIVVWSVTSVVLTWFLFGLVNKAISSTALKEERFGLVRWPLYPLRWVIVVGVSVFLVLALSNALRAIWGRSVLTDQARHDGAPSQGETAAEGREPL